MASLLPGLVMRFYLFSSVKINLTLLSLYCLGASAYENVEWIDKLVSWVADVAINRPRTKIIGLSSLPDPPFTSER